jgi:hypothetical protein
MTIPNRDLLGFHETTSTRSRKGRSSFKVTHRGTARITGADPVRAYLVDPDTVDLARLDSITLAKLADALFPCHCQLEQGETCQDSRHVPSLLGTHARAYASVTPSLTGRTLPDHERDEIASDARGVARHRSDLTGWTNALPRDFTPHTDAHGTARYPTRYRLPARRPRTGEHAIVEPLVMDGEQVGTLHRLLSWSTDPSVMFVGHDARPRTQLARSTRVTARNTGAPVKVDHETATTILDALTAPGEGPVTVTLPRGTLTMAPSGGKVRCTFVGSTGETRTWRARSVGAIAAFVA